MLGDLGLMLFLSQVTFVPAPDTVQGGETRIKPTTLGSLQGLSQTLVISPPPKAHIQRRGAETRRLGARPPEVTLPNLCMNSGNQKGRRYYK